MWLLIMISGILVSCNESDSTENRADSLTKKVDSVAQNVWDSGKQDLKNLKDRIQNELGNKDSIDN